MSGWREGNEEEERKRKGAYLKRGKKEGMKGIVSSGKVG
jgi:hypothetical protein